MWYKVDRRIIVSLEEVGVSLGIVGDQKRDERGRI